MPCGTPVSRGMRRRDRPLPGDLVGTICKIGCKPRESSPGNLIQGGNQELVGLQCQMLQTG